MSNDLYVVRKADYMQHITDKVELYNMLRTITEAASNFPGCESLAEFKCMAAHMEKCVKTMFDGWDMSDSSLADGVNARIAEQADKELLPLERYVAENCAKDASTDIRTMAEKLEKAIDRQTTVFEKILMEM